MAGADAHGREELPDINIFASVDAAGEDMWQRWLQLVEECFISVVPSEGYQ